MTHTDQSRAEFEHWVMRNPRPGTHLDRSRNGEYKDNRVKAKWAAWQAAINYAIANNHAGTASAEAGLRDCGTPTTEQSSGVELPEPVTWLIERHAFSVSPHGQDAEGNSWLEEAHEPGEQGSFAVYTEQQVRTLLAAIKESLTTAPSALQGWMPIESAPKDKTLLLGYRNSHGHWRTLLGEWFTREEIDEYWEDPDGVEPGWFETSVEADDVPNVWRTNPTHWMPLPQPPKEQDK